jgi:hypothetical protein
MKTARVATVHNAIKETILAHFTLVHVFHAIPQQASVGAPCTISVYITRYGGIASILATYAATKFAGPHKSHMRQYIINACSFKQKMQALIDTGGGYHLWSSEHDNRPLPDLPIQYSPFFPSCPPGLILTILSTNHILKSFQS